MHLNTHTLFVGALVLVCMLNLCSSGISNAVHNAGDEGTQRASSDPSDESEASGSSGDIAFSGSGSGEDIAFSDSGSGENGDWLGKSFLDDNDEVSIIFGGDINFDGPQRKLVEDGVCTYNGYMRKLKGLFSDADIKVANLESPVSDNLAAEHPSTGGPTHLLAHDIAIGALKYTGFDAVTLSNNHMLDWGESVIIKTERALNRTGIQYFGITEGMTNLANQQPLIMERKGLKFGFLAYCSINPCLDRRPGYKIGMSTYSKRVMVQDVQGLKDKVDFIIVLMHWSGEYVLYPDVYEENGTMQQALEMREAGVHLVIGGHPHISQGHSYYGDSFLVVYSVGNLLFNGRMTNGRMLYNAVHDSSSEKQKQNAVEVWQKLQAKLARVETGKLIRVVFNRTGIVRHKTDYMPMSSAMDDSGKCLTPDRVRGEDWERICADQDPQCLGVYTDNEMDEYLPHLAPPNGEDINHYSTLEKDKKTPKQLRKLAKKEEKKKKKEGKKRSQEKKWQGSNRWRWWWKGGGRGEGGKG